MERKPNNAQFLGFRFVRLPETCARNAQKFYRNGNLIAVHQSNGRIAVSNGVGIIDGTANPRWQWRAVQCLYGLGLVGDAIKNEYERRFNVADHAMEVQSCTSEAANLGYRLVKLPKPKKPPKRVYKNTTRL